MLVIMVTKEMITVCAGSTCGGDDIFKACDNVGDVGNDGVCVSCTSCGGDGVGMQVMLLKLLIIFYVGDT